MKNKLKVLFLPLWYPSKGFEGVSGIFCLEHVKSVEKLVDITVLHHYNDQKSFGTGYQWIESIENGIKKIDSISDFSRIPKTNFFLWQYNYKRSLKKYIKTYGKPDIIHANDDMAYLALRVAKPHNIPVVVSQHWTKLLNQNLGPIDRFMFKYIFKHAAAILPVNKFAQPEYEKRGFVSPNLIWLPNSFNDQIFYEDKSIQRDKFFLHVSGLTHTKNIEDLLTGFKKFSSNNKEYTLKILGGSASAIAEKSKIVDQLGLQDSVSFEGHQTKDYVAGQMRRCAAFVLPSSYETFGCVLMEAKACGAPIITTRVGGIPGVLAEGDARFVEVGDTDDIALGMAQIVDKSISLSPSDLIKSKFGYAAVGAKMYDIYTEILKQK